MSENTSIQEGGGSFPFGPVVALMVKGDDDKYYSWYPESSRQLDSLSVDANGVYQASKQGVYGWGSVYVNVPQTDHVTGTDPDTGEEVVVSTDPETGEIVETVIPSEIRVTTLPTKTTYADGETINYSGIIVHGYSSTGQDLGAIPFSELVFPVTKARNESECDWATSDLDTGVDKPLPFSSGVTVKCTWGTLNRYEYTHTRSDGGAAVTASYIGARFDYVFAKSTPGDFTIEDNYSNYDKQTGETHTGSQQSTSTATAFTHDGKTVYYAAGSYSIYNTISECTPANSKPINGHEREIAWTMIYGDITGAPQNLPVQWSRPGDGAVLETSFDITVTGGE